MWVMKVPAGQAFTSLFNGVWATVLYDPYTALAAMEIWLSCLVEGGKQRRWWEERQSFLCAGLLLKSRAGLRRAIAWQTASDLVQYGNHTQLQLLISISRGTSRVDPVEVNSCLWSNIMVDSAWDRLSPVYIICWHEKPYVVLCTFHVKKQQKHSKYRHRNYKMHTVSKCAQGLSGTTLFFSRHLYFLCPLFNTVNHTTPTSYADRHAWKLKTGLLYSYMWRFKGSRLL